MDGAKEVGGKGEAKGGGQGGAESAERSGNGLLLLSPHPVPPSCIRSLQSPLQQQCRRHPLHQDTFSFLETVR